MSVIRNFLFLAAVIAFLVFGFANLAERVTVTLFPNGQTWADVPLIIALLVAYAFGMFTWFLYSVFQELRIKQELRRARRDADRLRDELKALRNLPVRDLEDTGDVIEPEESIAP